MTAQPLLAATDLAVRFGASDALRGVDIEVRRGEVVGLIGPDGAGKTTTLRVLGGLLRHTAGDVRAFGVPVWRTRRALHRKVGYLAQRFALYGDLTVDENVQFFALLYGVRSWKERRDVLLRRVDLAQFRNRQADRLSGGMKQKLALACTLIHSPELLLLDEPTTGVDPVTRRELWRLLGELVTDGLTLVVATPYLDEAERCSRVTLMHEGRVLADGPPGDLPARLPGTVVEIVAAPRQRTVQALSGVPGLADLTVFGSTLHARLETPDAESAIRSALASARVEVAVLRTIRAGLEDTFLYLTATRTDGDSRGEAA